MEQNLLNRIVINDEILGGKPIIRNKRISAETILEFLSAGESFEEILHQYPSLEKEDILACLQFAVKLMKQNYIIKNVA
ncbi:MAG: DUF433 domain-containing protein [Leptospiraceae bacterium]|nr:DUF433 domain-containing protein [Leptospiraceae bacterium]